MLLNLLKEKQPYRLRDIFYVDRPKLVAMSYRYYKWIITFYQLVPSSSISLLNASDEEVIYIRAP
jgi:hypothetical protein